MASTARLQLVRSLTLDDAHRDFRRGLAHVEIEADAIDRDLELGRIGYPEARRRVRVLSGFLSGLADSHADASSEAAR